MSSGESTMHSTTDPYGWHVRTRFCELDVLMQHNDEVTCVA